MNRYTFCTLSNMVGSSPQDRSWITVFLSKWQYFWGQGACFSQLKKNNSKPKCVSLNPKLPPVCPKILQVYSLNDGGFNQIPVNRVIHPTCVLTTTLSTGGFKIYSGRPVAL